MKTNGTLLGYMARDQYGDTIHLTEPKHPRRQLLAKLGRQHAARMFYDSKSTGQPVHCGYIVGGRWFKLYEVHAWKGGQQP